MCAVRNETPAFFLLQVSPPPEKLARVVAVELFHHYFYSLEFRSEKDTTRKTKKRAGFRKSVYEEP